MHKWGPSSWEGYGRKGRIGGSACEIVCVEGLRQERCPSSPPTTTYTLRSSSPYKYIYGGSFWVMSVRSKICDWPVFPKMGTLLQGRNIMPCPTKCLCLYARACRASAVIGFVRAKRAQNGKFTRVVISWPLPFLVFLWLKAVAIRLARLKSRGAVSDLLLLLFLVTTQW